MPKFQRFEIPIDDYSKFNIYIYYILYIYYIDYNNNLYYRYKILIYNIYICNSLIQKLIININIYILIIKIHFKQR